MHEHEPQRLHEARQRGKHDDVSERANVSPSQSDAMTRSSFVETVLAVVGTVALLDLQRRLGGVLPWTSTRIDEWALGGLVVYAPVMLIRAGIRRRLSLRAAAVACIVALFGGVVVGFVVHVLTRS